MALFLACSLRAGAGSPIPRDRESLSSVATRYGFRKPPTYASPILASQWTTLVFEPDSRKMVFNDLRIWLNEPILNHAGALSVSRRDVTRILEPLLRPDRMLFFPVSPVVVLDPGHGGQDSGASGRYVKESLVVLDVCRRARALLIEKGVDVRLTRNEDAELSLAQRAAKAREWSASVFVSVHMNAAENADASGMETFTLPAPGSSSTSGDAARNGSHPGNAFDPLNTLLAFHVHRSMIASSAAPDRGVRHARFEVLKLAPCPAILVECGFVSHGMEEALLGSEAYRDTLARGLAEGILTYATAAKLTPDRPIF